MVAKSGGGGRDVGRVLRLIKRRFGFRIELFRNDVVDGLFHA